MSVKQSMRHSVWRWPWLIWAFAQWVRIKITSREMLPATWKHIFICINNATVASDLKFLKKLSGRVMLMSTCWAELETSIRFIMQDITALTKQELPPTPCTIEIMLHSGSPAIKISFLGSLWLVLTNNTTFTPPEIMEKWSAYSPQFCEQCFSLL